MPTLLCTAVKTIDMIRGVIPHPALNVAVVMCCERNVQERNALELVNYSKYTDVDDFIGTLPQILIEQNSFNNATNEIVFL